MAECLQQEGVTKVFGQCGHTNYALIDACRKLGIEYVSFRHEQMAAHAADAVLSRVAQAGRPQRAPFAGHDQRAHRRGDGGGRLHADGGDCGQHAVVSPCARAASGHQVPCRRVTGRHLSTGLQARVARRRCEVLAGRDAARPERGADRPAGGGAARRPDGRLLAARRLRRRRHDVRDAPGRADRSGARPIVEAASCSLAPGRRSSSPATA